MRLQDAMSQISEIHDHLLKAEVFRGYRSWPMAATGVLAIAAAVLQSTWLVPADAIDFVLHWLVVAGFSAAVLSLDLAAGLLGDQRASQRRRTLRAVLQFAPALAAGGIVTVTLLRRGAFGACLLPGLWALVYALGLFASRLHLPRAAGWVAAWFLCAATFLLADAGSGSSPSPWAMGVPFGAGQLALAWVFHSNLERSRRGSC